MLGIGQHGPLGARPDEDADGRPSGNVSSGSGPAPTIGERDAWVVLAGAEGVGPVTFGRLVAAFGSALAVLQAASAGDSCAELVAASRGPDGASPTLARAGALAIADAAARPWRLLGPVARSGVQVLTLADEAYPARLRAIDLPPPVLFLHGSPEALERVRAVAIVGTRRPTTQGRALAGQIAEAVAGFGATVVSGLALGIDAAAHSAAVRQRTPTVAVIGGGHDRLYPAAHRGLARAIIAEGGAIVSEFAPDTQPTRGTFPRRNRIISGLAEATVVVEAGSRSGALTTAAWALEQGRGLYLVPGRPGDPAVAGCLAFLREGGPDARIVAGVPELIEDLGYLDTAADGGHRGLVDTTLTAAEREVALHLVSGRGTVDELVHATGAASATVLGALTVLEMRGLAVGTFGRYRPAGALAAGGAVPPRTRTKPGDSDRPRAA